MEKNQPSTLNDLRQFRLQKNSTSKFSEENKAGKTVEENPIRKRIQISDDSDSDNEAPFIVEKYKKEFSVEEKESRFLSAAKIAVNFDSTDIQDALLRCNWDVSSAIKYLKEHFRPKTITAKKKYTNGVSHIEEDSLQADNGKTMEKNPIRKRIQVMDDSDSDNEAPIIIKKYKKEFSVEEKESRFLSAAKIAVDFDNMDIQDALLRCNWDVSSAIKYLKEHFRPKAIKAKKKHTNGISHIKNNSLQTDNDEEEHYRHSSTKQVYDSDDSDYEMSNEMTTDRQSVIDFLNNSTYSELLSVQGCSEKKVQLLMELRPFTTWSNLRETLENHKGLSTDILNSCQDLINKQNNVTNIMAQCNKMVQKLEAAIENGAGITEQPTILNSSLKLADYQIIGLNWLVVMYKQKMNGILADEMGLGKTIQVIAFLAYLKEKQLAKGTHLIVVPSSTLDNWGFELSKWCPNLNVEKYYGSQEERRMMRINYAKHGFKDIDVLLTTYRTVSSSPEERKMFRVSKLHYLIFDEAHMLKNMGTQRYTQLIEINAEMRLLLTGTPLQNNLLELMSLLCFLMPSFFLKMIDDIKSLFQKKSKKGNEESIFEKKQIERAKRIMKPFVLRRLKKDVLTCLPKKLDIIQTVPMLDEQKQLYKELVEFYSNDRGVIKGTAEVAGCAIMMEMRKLANHPLLMRYYFSDDYVHEISKRLARCSAYKKTNPQYIFEDLACASDFQIWQTCEKYDLDDVTIPDRLILNSGKFKELDSLLPKLKEEGHRVLMFSQFTMMLDIVEKYLDIRKHSYLRLDGQTMVTERQELIDRFNEESDIFIFILSTKAGGMGINLTAADTAIIHDIDFNPYNDKQAEDRCHRMGQTKPVTIYRLISEGTIEEGMLMVAQEKLNLEKEIHSEKDDDVQEHKCMVRLLTMALGMNEERAETLMTPPNKLSKDCKSKA